MKKTLSFLLAFSLQPLAFVFAGTTASLSFRTNDLMIMPTNVWQSNSAAIAGALAQIGFGGGSNGAGTNRFDPSQFSSNNGTGQVFVWNLNASNLSGTLALSNLNAAVLTNGATAAIGLSNNISIASNLFVRGAVQSGTSFIGLQDDLTNASGQTIPQQIAASVALLSNSLGSNITASNATFSNITVGTSFNILQNLYVNGEVVSGLFAGNGSGITNLNAANLAGTVPLANVDATVLTNGFTAPVTFGTNVTVNGLISGNGGGLTNVTATALPSNYSAAITLTNSGNIFAGNGLQITNLNGGAFSGPITNTNAALTSSIFSGQNNFSGDLAFNVQAVTSLAPGLNQAVSTGAANVIRISGVGGAFSIAGLTGGRAGRPLTIENDSGYSMTILNNSGIDTNPPNRIITSVGDYVVTNNPGMVQLVYDGASSSWKVVSTPTVATNAGPGVYTGTFAGTFSGAAGGNGGGLTNLTLNTSQSVVDSSPGLKQTALWNYGESIGAGNGSGSPFINDTGATNPMGGSIWFSNMGCAWQVSAELNLPVYSCANPGNSIIYNQWQWVMAPISTSTLPFTAGGGTNVIILYSYDAANTLKLSANGGGQTNAAAAYDIAMAWADNVIVLSTPNSCLQPTGATLLTPNNGYGTTNAGAQWFANADAPGEIWARTCKHQTAISHHPGDVFWITNTAPGFLSYGNCALNPALGGTLAIFTNGVLMTNLNCNTTNVNVNQNGNNASGTLGWSNYSTILPIPCAGVLMVSNASASTNQYVSIDGYWSTNIALPLNQVYSQGIFNQSGYWNGPAVTNCNVAFAAANALIRSYGFTNAFFRDINPYITTNFINPYDNIHLDQKGHKLAADLYVMDIRGNNCIRAGNDGMIPYDSFSQLFSSLGGFGANPWSGKNLFTNQANVFVGTGSTLQSTAFTGTNNWTGDLAYPALSLGTLTNGVNAAIPISTNTYIRLSGPSGAFSLDGVTGGRDGRIVKFENTTGQSMSINNESPSDSTAPNRIRTGIGGTFTLTNNPGLVELIYNTALNRWVLTSHN